MHELEYKLVHEFTCEYSKCKFMYEFIYEYA